MRFLVVGAGAIGGFVAGQLVRSGADVTVMARGEHAAVLARDGLLVRRPAGSYRVPVRVATTEDPQELLGGEELVALLAVKSQHTAEAVTSLRRFADVGTVACLQNGVANEGAVARFVPHVYGVQVLCPSVHLEPGVVTAYSDPVPGVLDVGRFCGGSDAQAAELVARFAAAGFASEVVPDLRAAKYAKLLTNLGNVVEVLVDPSARRGPVARAAEEEGRHCLAAAGIAIDPRPDRWALVTSRPVDGRDRPGASTWQSVRRGSGDTETDHLNGEVCRLGRLHGVPTPVNDLLALMMARRERLGAWTEQELMDRAGVRGGDAESCAAAYVLASRREGEMSDLPAPFDDGLDGQPVPGAPRPGPADPEEHPCPAT